MEFPKKLDLLSRLLMGPKIGSVIEYNRSTILPFMFGSHDNKTRAISANSKIERTIFIAVYTAPIFNLQGNNYLAHGKTVLFLSSAFKSPLTSTLFGAITNISLETF